MCTCLGHTKSAIPVESANWAGCWRLPFKTDATYAAYTTYLSMLHSLFGWTSRLHNGFIDSGRASNEQWELVTFATFAYCQSCMWCKPNHLCLVSIVSAFSTWQVTHSWISLGEQFWFLFSLCRWCAIWKLVNSSCLKIRPGECCSGLWSIMLTSWRKIGCKHLETVQCHAEICKTHWQSKLLIINCTDVWLPQWRRFGYC